MQIFFDVDGVLINGYHAGAPNPAKWSENIEVDLGLDRACFERLLFAPGKDGSPPRFHACLIGEADLAATLNSILPYCGYEGDPEAVIEYWLDKDSALNQPLLDAIDRIRAATAHRLFIASGQERRRATHLWDVLGLKRYFKSAFWTCDLGVLKYGPDFFCLMNQKLDLDFDNDPPLFFDDRENVVEAAKQAGWDAVLYSRLEDVTGHHRLRV